MLIVIVLKVRQCEVQTHCLRWPEHYALLEPLLLFHFLSPCFLLVTDLLKSSLETLPGRLPLSINGTMYTQATGKARKTDVYVPLLLIAAKPRSVEQLGILVCCIVWASWNDVRM